MIAREMYGAEDCKRRLPKSKTIFLETVFKRIWKLFICFLCSFETTGFMFGERLMRCSYKCLIQNMLQRFFMHPLSVYRSFYFSFTSVHAGISVVPQTAY